MRGHAAPVFLSVFRRLPYLRSLQITTTLADIAAKAEAKDAENQAFRTFLQSQESNSIDELVQELDALITPQIDCTTCGNCCRSLMINVTADEINVLAAHLGRTEEDVKKEYVETGSHGGIMIMNTIPCHFLKNDCCTIYEQRFEECREFPGLHNTQFTKRLFATLAHYGRCPIIYNVIEEMKVRLRFNS